jgi:REP element-mobilizing transposase RayT
MVVACHLIFGAYGFWLPNDPRGSWSDFVGSYELYRFGEATKTTETRSVARINHDRAARLAAKKALKRPPVVFTGIQARAVGDGFAGYVRASALKVFACAIMPDHVHLVIAGDGDRISARRLAIQLKGAASRKLVERVCHPFQTPGNPKTPKCFARGEWCVFLDPPMVPATIKYVRMNPVKENLPMQKWSFVTEFNG